MGTQPQTARTSRGYLQSFATGAALAAVTELFDESIVDGPVSTAASVAPAIAVVVRHALPAKAGPGAAVRVVGAAFLALQVRPAEEAETSVVLGEWVIDLPLRNLLTLSVNGSPVLACPPELFGDVHDRLRGTADRVGGLRPGDLVVLGPRGTEPARAGAGQVELLGPDGGVLLARVQP